ncbi:unnamed protein product [Rhizophagus irregularis]|nr:unnamed protein product [Rhizophagus irregularis]
MISHSQVSFPIRTKNSFDLKTKKFGKKKKEKEKIRTYPSASTSIEDEYTKLMRREATKKYYKEKAKAERIAKKQRPIEISKQDRYDLKFSPIFSSSFAKQDQKKKEEPKCVAMNLPLEIFIKIVEYATQETALALSLTCQKWYDWLTDGGSVYIDRAWRRSRNNTHPYLKKQKNGVCERIYTIRKMKPKPIWYRECDMCFKKSTTNSWNFGNELVKTCYNCMMMYKVKYT